MSVNGIELAVGQVWRCRDGKKRTIVSRDDDPHYPWNLSGGDSVSDSGKEWVSAPDELSDCDLIELILNPNAPDANALASELLTDLGWRFEGGTWVQDEPVQTNPLDVQVGGAHYKRLAIQPIEYIHANSLGFPEGSVIKYVTRWRDKNGIKDLEKARHFIDLLIALEQRKEAK